MGCKDTFLEQLFFLNASETEPKKRKAMLKKGNEHPHFIILVFAKAYLLHLVLQLPLSVHTSRSKDWRMRVSKSPYCSDYVSLNSPAVVSTVEIGSMTINKSPANSLGWYLGMKLQCNCSFNTISTASQGETHDAPRDEISRTPLSATTRDAKRTAPQLMLSPPRTDDPVQPT